MTLKLLLAGTDSPSFQLIKTVFAEDDVHLISATSIGLAIFLARKNQPHLIICEQQLIDGDGLGFFYETRNESELARIPFAFLLTDKEKEAYILKLLKSSYPDIYFLLSDNELDKQNSLDWKRKILDIVT